MTASQRLGLHANLEPLLAEKQLRDHGTGGMTFEQVYEAYMAAFDDDALASEAASRHARELELQKAREGG